MDKTKVTKDLEAKTLTIERAFTAPKSKVWRAYADKDWFVRWWGPEGWDTTVKEFDFRVGGRNLYAMKCVDKNQGDFYGQESWGLMEYEAINEPDSFSFVDAFANPDGSKQDGMPSTHMTITLEERGDQTVVVTRLVTETTEALEKLLAMGMVEGYESSCVRLEQLLAE